MTVYDLRSIIIADSKRIPDFIDSNIEVDRFRFGVISDILDNIELCINEYIMEQAELEIYDDMIKVYIMILDESCGDDKQMIFRIWAYLLNKFEIYIAMAENNELFESAANLQKIKSLYSGQ